MSDFPAGAPQIWAMEPRFQRSQFRAGNNGAPFRFVSSGGPGAKWRDVATSPLSRYNARRGQWVQGRHRTMRAILAVFAFVHCVRLPAKRQRRAHGRGHRARQGADRRRRLRELPYRRSRKTVRRGKRIDTPFGGIYSPNLTPDRDTGIGAWSDDDFLPRAAPRRRARRLALLPGLPLPEFHKADPRRHSGDPRLSGDADAGPQHAAAAGTALALQLSRRDARLELAVLQARHSDARPAKERGMESRPLSGRGRRPLRRLPYAEERLWRRQTRPGFWRRTRRGHVRAAARWRRAQRAEIVERGRHRRISAERPQRPAAMPAN